MTTRKPEPKTQKVKKEKTSAAKESAVVKNKAVTVTSKKAAAPKNDRQMLRSWNLWLAIALLIEAAVIVLLAKDLSVPLALNYVARDVLASEATGVQTFALAGRHLFDVPVAWILAKSLLILALAHLLVATVWRGHYNNWLQRGVNKMRWVAAGVVGGYIAVTIALLSGVNSLQFLVLLFGLSVAAGLCALAVELMGAGRRLRKVLALTAVCSGVGIWIILGSFVLGSVLYDGNMLAYLYGVYAVQFVLFAVGLVMSYLRLRQRGKFADTVYTERMFMLLGFMTVSLLAWQVFVGLLQ
ncbi:MAG TPA: heliorhodopsin HeR [Candidatus Saccharimonadales bacterium]|nr:heliorhodopsin HeR [Candidatus Saccharimonadales bacterium]